MRKQWLNLSNTAKDLVMKMLEVDPQKRITIEEALDHPWIKVNTDQRKWFVTELHVYDMKVDHIHFNNSV